MTEAPAGTRPVDGIVNMPSPLSVLDTAERLATLIGAHLADLPRLAETSFTGTFESSVLMVWMTMAPPKFFSAMTLSALN